MNGGSGECCGLLVLVVQFVEVLVQERRVIYAVQPVRRIVLKKSNRTMLNSKMATCPANLCLQTVLQIILSSGNEKFSKIWKSSFV